MTWNEYDEKRPSVLTKEDALQIAEELNQRAHSRYHDAIGDRIVGYSYAYHQATVFKEIISKIK